MKVTGSNITITDSVVNKMQILPLGNCEQDGTPTPDNPIDIKVVTGDNNVIVQNKNSAYIEDGFDGYFRDYRNGNKTYASSYNGYIARVKPNTTYIGSYDSNESERTGISNLCYFDKNMNYISGIQYTSAQGDIFTTPNNCTFVTVAVIKTQTKFQIELGTTATSFVPHQEQSTTLQLGSLELCKIGNYQDVITGSKDNWKVVRNVGKRIFIGVNATSLENLYICMLSDYLNQYGFCSHFTFYTDTLINNNADADSILSNGECAFRSGSTKDRLYFKSTKTKAELDLLNKEVYYVLSEPTEETITDTTLINDLNNLQELLSYDGTTNMTITSESSNAQMIAEVTYTSESDMNEKLTNIFNSIKSKLYHIIRAL